MKIEKKEHSSRTWSVLDLGRGASEILEAAAVHGPQRLVDGDRLFTVSLVGPARSKRAAGTVLAEGGPLEDDDFLE